MIEQKPLNIDIQIIEVSDKSISTNKKTDAHIGFVSSNPIDDIKVIKQWAKDKDIIFSQGSWSSREHWFDLPDVFSNFVVEIMDEKVLE